MYLQKDDNPGKENGFEQKPEGSDTQACEERKGSISVKKSFRGRIYMKMYLGLRVKECNLGISILGISIPLPLHLPSNK